MTQEEIYQVLKKSKKWMPASEIREKLDDPPTRISHHLNKLCKYHKEIKMKLRPALRKSIPIYKYSHKIARGEII